MIEVVYMHEMRDDKSEFEHIRDACKKFEVPDEVIEQIGEFYLKVGEDLLLMIKPVHICAHCFQQIEHIGSRTDRLAILRCSCGEWTGRCSPFSGSFYGGKIVYRKLTIKERQEAFQNRVRVLAAKMGGDYDTQTGVVCWRDRE